MQGIEAVQISFGPSGGLGGGEFSAVPPTDFHGVWKIRAIQVWSDQFIYGFQLVWANQDGDVRESPVIGGEKGKKQAPLYIDDDDYLTRIEGSAGSIPAGARVFSLGIFTKKSKNQPKASYGTPGSAKFQYNEVPGFQVIGFRGRAGVEIDALGVVIDKAPAWTA